MKRISTRISTQQHCRHGALHPVRAVLVIIVVATVVRVALAALTGLGIDESYMAGMSRQFALSYLDHPPLHVWLVGAWSRLSGSESALVLRLPFIALFAASTWLMFRLTAIAFGEQAGMWAALAFNLAPVFALSTASWVLPDGPLVFFLLLGACAAARLLFAGEPALPCWLAAGTAGGFALLSKYMGIFLIVGLGLFLITSPRDRRILATPPPWLGATVSVLLFTPVILWNGTHHWASFLFQGSRGLPEAFNINWILQDIGGQIGYLTPWIGLPMLYVLVRALRRGPAARASWFFAALAVVPIVLFTVLGLWTRVLPHWSIAGWLFAFPLLGDGIARWEPLRPRLVRLAAGCSAALLVAILGLAASQAATGWISRIAPTFARGDPTLDLLDWHALKPELAARGLIGPGMFVAAVRWFDAGKVNYALGGEPPVLCLCRDSHQFAFLHDVRQFAGHDAVVLSRSEWQLAAAARYFVRFEQLPDIILTRGGAPAIVLKTARGTGFLPLP
jgi:4-amino-4-deoxy-L-arabinose transferase-like glycosyltransferase